MHVKICSQILLKFTIYSSYDIGDDGKVNNIKSNETTLTTTTAITTKNQKKKKKQKKLWYKKSTTN